MRRIVDNDLLTMLARLIVGGAFIYASIYKIIEPAAFAKSIWFYHMVPGVLINLMALVLAWFELICGLFLILGIWYRGAVLGMFLMNLMFIIALSTAIAKGIDIDCGCFKASKGAGESAWQSLLTDIGLMILVLQMMASKSKRWLIKA